MNEEIINKPLSMLIKETKAKLINICNESKLTPVILDLIIQGIYSEIHALAEKQNMEEEINYFNIIKESNVKNEGENKIKDK